MIYIIILVVALFTYLTRFLPFLVMKNWQPSEKVMRCINALPFATISLLVVYCLKDTSSLNFIPTLIAVTSLIMIHLWKDNTLLSIFSSTAIYMILLQVL